MPEIMSLAHDQLIRRYIDSSVKRAIGQERLVMPLDKNGFIVPAKLMIKILPNLSEGL
jgi:hypothetical protein